MSNQPCFIDSNVWLYRLMTDPESAESEEVRKRSLAIALTDQTNHNANSIVSTQVINEVCAVLIRKASFTERQIELTIHAFYDRCTVVELDRDILINASTLRVQYGFSFWDSLIIASALSTDATIFYSEDMQDGLVVIDQLTIVNPFK
ncbi:PIN domain-containing protein [Phormidesmis priestleyi]